MSGVSLFSLSRRVQQIIYWLVCATLLTSASPLALGFAQAARPLPADPNQTDGPSQVKVNTLQPISLFLPLVLKNPVAGQSCQPGNDCPATVVGYVFNAGTDTP